MTLYIRRVSSPPPKNAQVVQHKIEALSPADFAQFRQFLVSWLIELYPQMEPQPPFILNKISQLYALMVGPFVPSLPSSQCICPAHPSLLPPPQAIASSEMPKGAPPQAPGPPLIRSRRAPDLPSARLQVRSEYPDNWKEAITILLHSLNIGQSMVDMFLRILDALDEEIINSEFHRSPTDAAISMKVMSHSGPLPSTKRDHFEGVSMPAEHPVS